MGKNYYQILQIDTSASPEIIEKAYKTLAKKYHPDLQKDADKKNAEEILKKINEAYETLSNPVKKMEYDKTIQQHTISKEDYNNVIRQNQILKNKLNNMQNNPQSNYYATNPNNYNQTAYNNTNYAQTQYEQEIQRAKQKAYHDAYINDLKRRGYRVKYKKTFKDYCKNFIALVITLIIVFILFQIPFIKNFFIDLYNENFIFKSLIDTVLGFFK